MATEFGSLNPKIIKIPTKISIINALCFHIPQCKIDVSVRRAAIRLRDFGWTKGFKTARAKF
jgi:hypothetical protein